MHDVLACRWPCQMNEVRMQRRLPIVDLPLGQNANEIIGVQVNRIGVGRRYVVPEPSEDEPWTRSEKVLPARRAERCLETRIVHDPRGGQNLFGVGRPNDAEFALPVHRSLSSPSRRW